MCWPGCHQSAIWNPPSFPVPLVKTSRWTFLITIKIAKTTIGSTVEWFWLWLWGEPGNFQCRNIFSAPPSPQYWTVPCGGLQSKIPKKSALEEPYYALDHLTRRHPHFWKASCMGAVTRKSFPTWTHIITLSFQTNSQASQMWAKISSKAFQCNAIWFCSLQHTCQQTAAFWNLANMIFGFDVQWYNW